MQLVSIDMMSKIISTNENYTVRLGRQLGSQLKGGELLILQGDLGVGKTTLVKGIVEGAGGSNKVSSPSFTLEKIYKTPNLTIYHYDLYRLTDSGILFDIISEALEENNSVVVVEWAELLGEEILDIAYLIKISNDPSNISKRIIKLVPGKKLNYQLSLQQEATR